MDKIIFLDFDGVLNFSKMEESDIAGKTKSDRVSISAVCNLNQVVEETGADIVISSTWRMHGLDYCVAKLEEAGFKGQVIGMTPRLHESYIVRGNEIKAFMKPITEKFQYVIVDDDSDMLYEHRNNFVQTSHKLGLTSVVAYLMIEVLNN